MKNVLRILSRVTLSIAIAVYVLVALANYSVVQTVVGGVVSERLSKEWGGEVRIASLHAMPFDHLLADGVLLVDPAGDTVLNARHLRVRMDGFPYGNHGLKLRSVYLSDAYYHFSNAAGHSTNLDFIISHYRKPRTKEKRHHEPFTVDVGELILRRVHYKMDLREHNPRRYENGVDIKHMEFREVNGRFRGVYVVNDDVSVRIVRLAAREKSGFVVNKISGNVHVGNHDITAHNMRIETPRSSIGVDAKLEYDGWHGMKGYVNTVWHDVVIAEGTTVAMSDVAYWAPVLWGIDLQVEASGHAWGRIDSLATDGLRAGWGQSAVVDISGTVCGLPRVGEMAIDANINRLYVPSSDVPPSVASMLGKDAMNHIRVLEYVDVQGECHGRLTNDAMVKVYAGTGKGHLSLLASRSNDDVAITLNSGSMDLGELTKGNVRYARVDADLRVANVISMMKRAKSQSAGVWPKHFLQGLDASGDVWLRNVALRNYSVDAVHLLLSGADSVVKADAELKMGYDGIMSVSGTLAANGDMPHIELRGQAGNIPIGGKLDTVSVSAFEVVADGESLATLTGKADVVGLHAAGATIGDLSARMQHAGRDKAEVDVNGDLLEGSAVLSFSDTALDAVQFNVRWRDAKGCLPVVVKGLQVSPNSRVDGFYTAAHVMRVVARCPEVSLRGVAISDIGLVADASPTGCNVMCDVTQVEASGYKLMEDMLLTAHYPSIDSLSAWRSLSDTAKLSLKWGNDTRNTEGEMVCDLREGVLNFSNSGFRIGNNHWRIESPTGVDLRDGIVCKGLMLSAENQQMSADVGLGGGNNMLEVRFDNFDIGTPVSFLMQDKGLNLTAMVDGRFTMYGIGSMPYFNAKLMLGNTLVNNQPLGTIACTSTWNAELNVLNIDANSDLMHLGGEILLGEEGVGLNVGMKFDNFDLAVVSPLLTSFASRFEGRLHGDFELGGTLRAPTLMGEAYVDGGALTINATGVTYYFNDSISVVGNEARLSNFSIIDPVGNVASVNGRIAYRGLKETGIEMTLSSDNIMLLNLSEREGYYGTIFASANGRVSGSIDDLNVDVAARTSLGSSLSVPINQQRKVKGVSYISFVGDEEEQMVVERKSKRNGKMSVEADISITPDLHLNIPIDLSQVSISATAEGRGDLHLSMNENFSPDIKGNYEITSGDLDVGILGIIDKNFVIEQGSSLNFQGSLPDARFDVAAAYRQRANLSSLTGAISSSDNSQKYIQVENVISISGSMRDPDIKFDLRLPNADQSVEEEVFAYIDRNSERDMLNQTISLLVLGTFYNASGNSDVAQQGGTTSLSTLGGTLASVLTDMVDVVDIDVDYKAGNELIREQIDVNISKDWGRWYIESTLGYGGDSRQIEQEQLTNMAVIDALLGYRLTSMVHIYAYNRTNTNDYTRASLPYKQGLGLKFTRDFDRWSDFFNRKK